MSANQKLTKVDGTTYRVDWNGRQPGDGFYFVEQMKGGTWDAAHSLNPDPVDRRYTQTWSSPAHKSRRGALQAISSHRRRRVPTRMSYVATA